MLEKISVVLSSNPTESEKFAVSELGYFLRKIADVELVLSKEFALWGNLKYPYISVGETELFKASHDFDFIKKEVGDDGYYIGMTSNEAYICGGSGQGTVYGVYGFLKKLFNLEIYTKDEYTFDKGKLNFTPFEIMEKPDFPMRAVGIYPVHLEEIIPGLGDKTYCYRMRLRQMDEGWGISNHTYFRVLPPSVYMKDHPDWYDKTKTTLCLSNKEMTAQFIENMKVIIEQTPSDKCYMIGMEDNVNVCDCAECAKIADRYNGYYGALMLIFVNNVVNALDEWLKKEHPERDVKFFTFAYVWAEIPPVKKDINGAYSLLFEDLKPAENLGVLLAPLRSNASFSMVDVRNIESLNTNYHRGNRIPVKEIFEGWRAVVNFLGVWMYNLNFYDYICPCPMWFGMDQNFRWLKELDSFYVFLDAGCDCVYSNFDKMKIYCVSQLMWNSSANLGELIINFMKVYYGHEWEIIYKYFFEIHKHAIWLNENLDRQMVFVQFEDDPNDRIIDARFWPKQLLKKWIALFDKAIERESDQKYIDRILCESVPAKYVLLSLYRKTLKKEEVLSMIKELREVSEKAGIKRVCVHEPCYMNDVLDGWIKEFQ